MGVGTVTAVLLLTGEPVLLLTGEPVLLLRGEPVLLLRGELVPLLEGEEAVMWSGMVTLWNARRIQCSLVNRFQGPGKRWRRGRSGGCVKGTLGGGRIKSLVNRLQGPDRVCCVECDDRLRGCVECVTTTCVHAP